MNDRFKFRAWNKETKTMHYKAEQTYDCMTGKPIIYKTSFGDILEDEDYIVEQCTGLKDKNGNLVFEGDVISYDVDSERMGRIACIQYSLAHFFLCRNGMDVFELWSAINVEVLGNIHENPELLK